MSQPKEIDLNPPNEVRLEDIVIDTILESPQVVSSLLGVLTPEMFYNANNALIFEAILKTYSDQAKFSIEQVIALLDLQGSLGVVGGRSGLFERLRSGQAIYGGGILAYAEKIAHAYEQRLYQRFCRDMAQAFQSDLPEAKLRFEQGLIDLRKKIAASPVQEMSRIITDAFVSLGDRHSDFYAVNPKLESLSTGFADLDALLYGGIPRKRLVYILGSSGMGKTTLGLLLARHCAFQSKEPVLFFSLEMGLEDQAFKLIADECSIPLGDIITANFSADKFGAIAGMIDDYDQAKFYGDDKTREIGEIVLKAKRFASQHGQIGMILIDYLTLIKSKDQSFGNRTQQIEGICYELNQLKKDLNTRVVVLTQIGRSVKERQDKRPQINDAKESGAIEETADLLLGTYRDEYYNSDTTSKGILEVSVLKNRYGKAGTKAELIWQGEYSRILNRRQT